ncbi:MAG: crotonase/enoyl-CoA hydratase family protein [Alphaproteobacteria bacterium]|nr:crotonase/enoyl-CoA hydratase family protein [Alphaproteobacteria bacterium]
MNAPQSPLASTAFSVAIADHVARITLSRPDKANSMIPEFWNDLPRVVRDIDANARARAILLSAQGKHFSSGMDLSVFAGSALAGEEADVARRGEAFVHHVRTLQDAFSCLDEARMPVVAAIQGACVGAGVDLVTACDIRYATQDAFFCIQETNIGMTADVGTFPRLCHIVPQGWVRELAYTGRRLPAAKAKEIGLVNEVFASHAEMMEAAEATAREIAAKSPVAVAGCKRVINHARDHGVRDTLDFIGVWNAAMIRTEDMRLALEAQMKKTSPEFQDLLPVKRGL